MAVDQQALKDFGGDKPGYVVQINPVDNKPYLVTTGNDPKNATKALPAYIYVDSKGNYTPSTSLNAVVNLYLKDLTASHGLEAMRTVLFNNGLLTKKEFDSKNYAAFLENFGKYVNDFSVNQASKIATGASTSLIPFVAWSRSAEGGAGGVSGTSKTTSKSTAADTSTITTKSTATDNITDTTLSSSIQANNELDAYYQEQLGRNATALEQAAYQNQLNAQEAASTTNRQSFEQSSGTEGSTTSSATTATSSGTQTVSGSSTTTTGTGSSATSSTGTRTSLTGRTGTTTTTGGPLTQADHNRIMGQVLATSLKGLSGEDLMKTNGAIAQGISDLIAYAGDYAIPNYTADIAKGHITDKLASGAGATPALTTLDAEKGVIRSMAKAFYPNLSKLIDEGVKVSSIGSIYASKAQQVLELPASSFDITNDPYISKALLNKDATGKQQDGTQNLNDFTIALRNDPRWAKTQNAREEAAGYANSILQSFGLA
jgi:hypothetical protein